MTDDELSRVSQFTITTAEVMHGVQFIKLDFPGARFPALLSPDMALELSESLKRNVNLILT